MQKNARTISLRIVIIAGMVVLVSLTTACWPLPGSSNPGTQASPTSAAIGTTTIQPTSTSTPTPTPSVDRHGLPEGVPLPGNAVFNTKTVSALFSVGPINLPKVTAGCITLPGSQTWVWTVASDAATMQKFYQDNLPGAGWSPVHVHQGCQGEYSVLSGCKGASSPILLVEIGSKVTLADAKGNPTSTVTAPAGGVVLAMSLVPYQQGHTDPTLGIYIPGAADVFCS